MLHHSAALIVGISNIRSPACLELFEKLQRPMKTQGLYEWKTKEALHISFLFWYWVLQMRREEGVWIPILISHQMEWRCLSCTKEKRRHVMKKIKESLGNRVLYDKKVSTVQDKQNLLKTTFQLFVLRLNSTVFVYLH